MNALVWKEDYPDCAEAELEKFSLDMRQAIKVHCNQTMDGWDYRFSFMGYWVSPLSKEFKTKDEVKRQAEIAAHRIFRVFREGVI